jgi:SAM-dependent methyltransferase
LLLILREVGQPRSGERACASLGAGGEEAAFAGAGDPVADGLAWASFLLGEGVQDAAAVAVGCGPGHVARYLHERGCDVFGIDISPRMIELARTLNPGIDFRIGDLRSLEIDENNLAGIACFYSLIHHEAAQLIPALTGLRRALRPGGRLALAVHEGTETRQPGEMWGIPVELKFTFFTRQQLTAALEASNFTIEHITHRAPYPEVEVATSRLYATATATTAQ